MLDIKKPRLFENPRTDYFDTLSKEEIGIEEGGTSHEQRKEAGSLPCNSTNHSDLDAQEGTPATATRRRYPILSKMMNSSRSGVFTAQEPRPREQEKVMADNTVRENRPCTIHASKNQGKTYTIESEAPKGTSEEIRVMEAIQDRLTSTNYRDQMMTDFETPIFNSNWLQRSVGKKTKGVGQKRKAIYSRIRPIVKYPKLGLKENKELGSKGPREVTHLINNPGEDFHYTIGKADLKKTNEAQAIAIIEDKPGGLEEPLVTDNVSTKPSFSDKACKSSPRVRIKDHARRLKTDGN